MRVLFVHPHFPGHFGMLADQLTRAFGWECLVLASSSAQSYALPYQVALYHITPGEVSRNYEHPVTLADNQAHMEAILRAGKALQTQHGFEPDLVVGHMCCGTLLYLKTVFRCPFLGYFDFLPPPFWSAEFALRGDYPPDESIRLAAPLNNAFTYLQLHAVDAILTPTRFQLSTLPPEFHYKAHVIFDCGQFDLGCTRPVPRPHEFLGHTFEPETSIVTYVSRGLEAIRGFDIFMQAAKCIYQQVDDVRIFVAGEPGSVYGSEMTNLQARTFKDHVLASDEYDLSKIIFLGRISPAALAQLLVLSDVHLYLTVPYVLSWSLLHAMAAECTIVGSATPPVEELIDDGVHGLLADFYDVASLAERATAVLRDPGSYRHLGQAARKRILQSYGLEKTAQEFEALAQQLVSG